MERARAVFVESIDSGIIIVALGVVESPEARWSQLEHTIERINTVLIASIKWYLINRLLLYLATVLDSLMLAFSSLYPA